jgi:hypothetical protein
MGQDSVLAPALGFVFFFRAYKRDIKIKPVFRELGAIQYDERNSSIGLDKISLTTFRDKKRLVL